MLDISAVEMEAARDWASDCLGMTGGDKASPARAARYVEVNYPGGWAAFITECIATFDVPRAAAAKL